MAVNRGGRDSLLANLERGFCVSGKWALSLEPRGELGHDLTEHQQKRTHRSVAEGPCQRKVGPRCRTWLELPMGKGGEHGDYRNIVLALASVQEMADRVSGCRHCLKRVARQGKETRPAGTRPQSRDRGPVVSRRTCTHRRARSAAASLRAAWRFTLFTSRQWRPERHWNATGTGQSRRFRRRNPAQSDRT